MTDSVFLRAVNFLDKFLSKVLTRPEILQLVGTVCIFISAKLNGTCISADRLSVYTAQSVAPDMILVSEKFLLYLQLYHLAFLNIL